MYGVAYTPDAVTDKPKINGVALSGKAHPHIGGRGGNRGRVSGYPYTEDTEVGDNLQGILVSSASGIPGGCVSSTSVWWTRMKKPMRVCNHTKSWTIMSGERKASTRRRYLNRGYHLCL